MRDEWDAYVQIIRDRRDKEENKAKFKMGDLVDRGMGKNKRPRICRVTYVRWDNLSQKLYYTLLNINTHRTQYDYEENLTKYNVDKELSYYI
jgi:hypothetical protein